MRSPSITRFIKSEFEKFKLGEFPGILVDVGALLWVVHSTAGVVLMVMRRSSFWQRTLFSCSRRAIRESCLFKVGAKGANLQVCEWSLFNNWRLPTQVHP